MAEVLKKKEKEKDDDFQLEFIISYVIKSLRLKPEKWHKMIGTDSLKEIVMEWTSQPNVKLLIFTMNSVGLLIPSLTYPTLSRTKTCFFIKKSFTEITKENVKDVILFGDMSSRPIEDLSIIVDEIFFPILNNPKNRVGWPPVITEDVESHLQELRNTIAEVKGSIMNQTILPLPMTIDDVLKKQSDIINGNLDVCDLKMKNSLEGIVIKWVTSINDILKEDSSTLMVNGNPSPAIEIKFWNDRLNNLQNIYNQLRTNNIKCVASVLETIDSVYFTSFRATFKNVITALVKARDITLYINPLGTHIETIESTEFCDSKSLLKPLIHCVCLIWSNSRYYCTNNHMVKLFKMIGNMLISQSTKYLEPGSLFQGEVDDGLLKIEKTIEIIIYFKSQYYEYRNKLSDFILPETNPIFWTFKSSTIFERLDLYIKRLRDIRNIFEAANDFIKLEKIEIGGLKGRNISRNLGKIYDDFLNIYAHWTSIQFDPLDSDPRIKFFEIEKRKFKEKTDILERKLATLLAQSFDECENIEQFNKLNQMAGSLLQRPIILLDVKEKYLLIVKYFNEELFVVKSLFKVGVNEYKKNGMKSFHGFHGFPPIAGTFSWINSLRERLVRPSNDFQYLEFPVFDSDEGKYLLKQFHDFLLELKDFENKIFQKWVEKVPEKVNSSMDQTILKRNEETLLVVNFNIELIELLKEVKYMKPMNLENIPVELLNIYEINDELWKARIKISRIVEWYNFLHKNTNSCEFNMIKIEIDIVDNEFIKGLTEEKWNSFDQNYLENIFSHIQTLYKRILQAQENINILKGSISLWGDIPLFERKDKRLLLNIEDRITKVNKRHMECKKSAILIENIMDVNFQLFCNHSMTSSPYLSKDSLYARKNIKIKVEQQSQTGADDLYDFSKEKTQNDESQNLHSAKIYATKTVNSDEKKRHYKAYKEFIDELILSEIKIAVINSLEYILIEMESQNKNIYPIFEVKLELQEPDIIFIPSLDLENKSGFLSLIKQIIDDIFSMSNLIPRIIELNVENYQSYKDLIEIDPEIMIMKEKILKNTKITIFSAIDYTAKYNQYKYLWMDNKIKVLNYFLKNGFTPKTSDSLFKKTINFKENHQPTLEMFKEQIDHYNDLYEEINKMKVKHIFNGWLHVDIKSFKQSLLNHVCKWSNLFKQNLVERVINSLQELENFIENGNKILQRTVTKEDFSILLKVMSVLSQIRTREKLTNSMFEPLKEIVDLLKQYNVDFSSKVLAQFLDLPEKWLRLKKNAIIIRLSVAPIQSYQVDQINKKIILFDLKMKIYSEKFHELPFFYVPCSNVYNICDNVDIELKEMEKELKNLNDSATLFELISPCLDKLHNFRKELRMIKQLWDFVFVIESSVNDWKKTPWKKIDVEDMEQECKKLAKDIRTLDKDMRLWNPYIYLEMLIKNLVTSLRAITELQNPAIRERHWIELMQVTKLMDIYGKDLLIRFNLDESTTLADLLDLRLHEYEDEVKNIVDKSIKEMSMEKTLNDLSSTWSVMEFDYELHPRTELKLLRATEELIETLEENQVQLQNLLGSKYVTFFLNEVMKWQSSLANADQVISIWFEVQRKWMYLESIFIGSEDIRAQLPLDSQRFDTIDGEFKEILKKLSYSSNVVKVTNKKGLYDRLDLLLQQLILCEKALNNYLETKRLAFPRFYFVSSADLLDILSNGNNPSLVCRHLTKLFDSIAKLKFAIDDGKNAIGMISKEHEEYVDFKETCDCSGKVEVWLNRLTNSMRSTLHNLFESSAQAYEDKPRDAWIFDWPAQTALCGTQIWWTTDVNYAFILLEEGYENSLKDYNKKQITQLNALIMLLLGDLTSGDRQKIMTVCTIDVHSRDVVAKMIAQKIESGSAFQWQSQLRHRWDNKLQDCFANICDAQFQYDYEYLGNTPRLVITPLTDRCYITLTQSLHLIMGGAPAGPAGTGKTETTKDLGRALGIMVYVFNCSEQMDYKSCGNIYKGLAQTGAWGCFDEFNRISVEVLSVVAVQVKTIQDAIKGGKKYATLDDHKDKTKKLKFNFMGEIISLVSTVGIFITMNPGYAGRTELPENLKALFRPCAMVVPDFALICEIMLVAEGFQEARLLARKFITLYTLCRELLSKQDHYDWGLRAIKSVLVVAGSLKRGDRLRPEDQVLMRALRDFNTPKIVTDDVPVFMGLIGDLFPALDVPRKRMVEFEKIVKKSAADLKLQPEDGYVLKVVQLEELFAVRHSVFIVGNAGTGKTEIWKGLYRTYQNQKRKPYFNDLNPKAVTNDELFGIINPATREWKDGLFSVIMRDQANMPGTGPRWIVLDGDIDPMWIESLNTVMDDNKVLTLASNERISLTKEMRLLFEIGHLRTATPATVSRAGILYINPLDLGWYPFVASWIDSRESQTEKNYLMLLFDKYVPVLLETNKKFKKITPISDIAMIQMTCHLLDCLLTSQNILPDSPKEWYEIFFCFSVVWGFGSALFQDQLIDWRSEFSKWWINEFKSIKYPLDDSVFNYYIDPITKKFISWSNLVPGYELDCDIPLQSVIVPTRETSRIKYFLDILMERKHPVMLVGGSGVGKSVIVADKLNNLSNNFSVTNVPFNFYTTSEMLQTILEKPLEKKAGRNYGPPGNKTMIYFVDDMNMPEVDSYGTVQPHTIIRQFLDYQHWYDRTKLTLKDIHNCQFISCMNPTAGAFTIDTRLQRHFCVFAVSFPSGESLFQIYNSILSQHLNNSNNKFTLNVQKMCSLIVKTELALHAKVVSQFLPTAVKFHYIFNLRDLANIFQGILFANNDTCPEPSCLIRLWFHEATRVYGDKLVSLKDIDTFKKLIIEITKKGFEDLEEGKVISEPMIYCHFADGLVDPKYMPVQSWEKLGEILQKAQINYNEIVGNLNLVLFEDAMSHICRISRIIEGPRGNALLIGVGGSGKQSLGRLSAFISSLSVTQIQLRKGYSLIDLKNDLALLYIKVGVKNVGSMFLMTDSQIAEEEFLVLINDMLASGEIPNLFPDDEIDNIINAVRNEVKQLGILDTKQNCWQYFIEKVRKMLKTVLCFSPVGSSLRIRARKFPAVVNCTAIDWFHEWPKKALESVSKKFLSDIEILPSDLTISVSTFMAYVHGTVNEMSKVYTQNEKRYNYTTPKSFLELISLYTKLLSEKTFELKEKIIRLENGILKLSECAMQVDSLQERLVQQEIELKLKNEMADKLIGVVSAENEKVQKEKFHAAEEEKKVRAIEEDVSIKAKLCEEDLRRAEPALVAAQEALNTLNKNNLTELRSFGSPPQAVVNVCAAVMVLFSPRGKLPKDRSWRASKMMMGKVDQFLYDLINYDKEHIRSNVISALQPYLKNHEFDPLKIVSKSAAAAGLCAWVININKFYEVFLVVEPKQRALKEAKVELKAAQDKLEYLNIKINELEDKLKEIQDEFDGALKEKQKCQSEADKTSFTIDLANRLIGGLASENIRWRDSVSNFKNHIVTLPGDVLLVSCFISYVGSFTRHYRSELLERMWLTTFENIKPYIPHTFAVDPLRLICDEAVIASWNNEGLPSDRMSTENAAILTNSARWPLMIDPQLQGIKWIKQKYGTKLIVIRLTMKGYIDIIEKALANGDILLIENIGESIDAVLDPLLGRALIKKGKVLKIGEKEMDYDPRFRLILQTKLGNPHYKPEMQAQTTLINFTVTRDGLEEQLLAEVVKAERPDLEKLKTELTMQQNTFKITLKVLEDDLLQRLASAGENVLEDPTLVLNLEKTKKTAEEIEVKVKESRVTSVEIDIAREHYRSAAERASILYFILNDLHKINPIYQFSLKAFIVVFKNAITNAVKNNNLKLRVTNLIDSITFSVFMYTCRGLFEKDKLIFMAQMVIQILLQAGEIKTIELDFLLRYPYSQNITSPFDFLSNISWGGIKSLSSIDEFRNLDRDIEASAKRWKKFLESECPEKDKFPGEWKNKTALQRLCMMRALRPDRMTYAIRAFVEEKLGCKYVEARSTEFMKSFEESSHTTPIFFILSPGVDPLVDLEKVGKKLNFSIDNGNFYNVSLGQGQELIAEAAMDIASIKGYWVVLQNIHLVANWLCTLEKKIESTTEDSHNDYRLFISAEPASIPEYHIIPQGILESCIKITNEPPTGMQANLHKALDNFNQETIEMCSKEAEFKSILFSLCYFHAVVAERRKFGPQGWNRIYPFNVGDLTISIYVLFNYLEANSKIPWEDLRYLFGEIFWGGHITDDWDRRLCRTYLEEFMQPELVDGDLFLCPGFLAPSNTDFMGYHKYIDEHLPTESPYLYGLHPNAEIGFLTTLSDQLFKTIFELQPRDSGSYSNSSVSREETVKIILEDVMDKVPEEFNMVDIMVRVEERTPYVIVAFQECERMNFLVGEIRRSLKELFLGLKGELTITSDMENLEEALFFDHVPDNWERLAYPSLLGLQSWFADLILRFKELDHWSSDFSLPSSIWLAGFFNPQSFLTAIMQQTARKNEWPLDKMCLCCEVTKKQKDFFTIPPKEGAYVNGLFMEGARWDTTIGAIESSRLKELFPLMPVIYIKAVTQDKQDIRNIYECPVYKTRMRGQTFVWTFNLKTKKKPSMWIMGGVCLLLQV